MTDPELRRLALATMLPSFPGHIAPRWALDLLAQGLAGYTLFGYNVADPTQLAALVAELRAGRPDAIVSIDEEGGDVTRLFHAEGSDQPGNAALGAAGDPDLTYTSYRRIGADLAAVGVNVDFAPSADVNSADENPVIGIRSFGSDPELVARHTAAAVRGLQDAGVAACAKHFPGHGATVTDSHHELPLIADPVDVIRRRDLPPFVAAIAAGVRQIMTAHIRVPDWTGTAPATASARVLTGLLRDELGFAGAVVTDALDMRAASGEIGLPEAAVRALAAGADLLCLGSRTDAVACDAVADAIVAAVRDGRLDGDRLEEAAARGAASVRDLVPAPVPRPAPLTATITGGLVTAPSHPAGGTPPGRGVGSAALDAARRALRVEGELPELLDPLIVRLESAVSPAIAADGRSTPWGLPLPAAEMLTIAVPPGDAVPAGPSAAEIVTRAGHRPIVVEGRDTHRWPAARTLITELAARHGCVVLVEMGWPGPWRPAGLRGYVATYGASRANAAAAAALLRAPHDAATPA